MNVTTTTEQARVFRQLQLDAAKTQTERNKLGQFATPTDLSSDILQYAKELLTPHSQIRFLDPAFGTGAFYSALLQLFSPTQVKEAVGVATCNYKCPNLQSRHFQTRIICNYNFI